MLKFSITDDLLDGGGEGLLQEFSISAGDLTLIRNFGINLEGQIDSFVEAFHDRLKEQTYYTDFFKDPETVERVVHQQQGYWREFFKGDISSEFIQSRITVGNAHARINLPLNNYLASMNFIAEICADFIDFDKSLTSTPFKTMLAINKLLNLDGSIVVVTYAKGINDVLHSRSEELETEVSERKQAEQILTKKVKQEEMFNKMAVDRELKMIELKKEVNELLQKAGEEERYKII